VFDVASIFKMWYKIPKMAKYLHYPEQREKFNEDHIRDVYDGDLYKKMYKRIEDRGFDMQYVHFCGLCNDPVTTDVHKKNSLMPGMIVVTNNSITIHPYFTYNSPIIHP
jgi:hypothetical protein